ncbi:MAG: hypothetical protein Q4C83_01700 [Candidatus Saccharibacteria bacterium]|nr:hypothetical protein [Candidatus Saccharibacteria bacterium]
MERADERSSSGEGTLSLSLSPNTNSDTNGNINLTIPTGGGVVNGSHTINYTISNIPTGLVSTTYNLTLSSKTSNTDMLLLDPVTSEVKNKLPTITPDTTNSNSTTTNNSDTTNKYWWQTNTTTNTITSNTKYPLTNITNPTTIISNTKQATGTGSTSTTSNITGSNQITWYANIPNTTTYPAGTYSIDIIYTLTTDFTYPAPTATNFIMGDTYYQGKTKTFAIEGTNLDTTYPYDEQTNKSGVYLVKTGDNPNDESNRHYATNINTYTDTATSSNKSKVGKILTFTNPILNELGTYNVYIETKGGVTKLADTTNNTNQQLHIVNNSKCQSNDTINSNCTIDIDSNMIPIVYDETNKVWVKAQTTGTNANWYNYTNKKWANAVTVTADTLDTYKNAQPGTEVNNNDILGYWVYIPRYAYEVQRRDAVDKYVTDEYTLPDNTKLKNEFIIQFEKADTAKSSPKECLANAQITTAAQMWKDGQIPGANDDQSTLVLAKDYRTNCNIDRTYNNQATNYNTTWATHPGFTFGTKELNGIWVGKFETTGTRTAPTIKPNQHANVSEYIGRFYTMAKSIGVEDPNNTGGNTISGITQNSHNLATATSHMQKNSEWGAVAYLSASSYGAGTNNVQINSAYPTTSADADGTSSRYGITGCGPRSSGSTPTYDDGTALNAATIESPTACSQDTTRAYNGTIGQLASTTNNIYGIYDMSGGTLEYIMGNLTTQDDVTESYSTSIMQNPTKPPYVDLYKVSQGFGIDTNNPGTKPAWSSSSSFQLSNNDVCTWLTCGGQALHETKRAQSVTSDGQSWGSDYSFLQYYVIRWSLRGGGTSNGSYAGVFYSGSGSGYDGNPYGSRVVLIAPAQ